MKHNLDTLEWAPAPYRAVGLRDIREAEVSGHLVTSGFTTGHNGPDEAYLMVDTYSSDQTSEWPHLDALFGRKEWQAWLASK